MECLILLLRGINVGGKNLLPMEGLRKLVEEAGGTDPETYIQSGNCVFKLDSRDMEPFGDKLRAEIREQYGFEPSTLILRTSDLKAALASISFKPEEPKHLHVWFLEEPAIAPDLNRIDAFKAGREEYELLENLFILHAPDGIGRSRLAANIEKILGVHATARNLNTIIRILELAE